MISERAEVLKAHFRPGAVPADDRTFWERLADRRYGVPDPRRKKTRRRKKRKYPYITDPNYYRLAYHLAAQQENGRLAEEAAAKDPASPPSLQSQSPPSPQLICQRLLRDADTVLTWQAARKRPRWWRFWFEGKLPPEQLRLRDFLENTIQPSARLLLAALLLASEPDESKELLDKVLERPKDELSYRTLYNMACYVLAAAPKRTHPAQPPTDEHDRAMRRALALIAAALRKPDRRRRTQLVHLAESDPSLIALREPPYDAMLDDLLSEYKPQQPEEKAQATGIGERLAHLWKRIVDCLWKRGAE